MRILFAGTANCAVPVLEMLAKDFSLCGLLTNPPAARGRSKKLCPSEVEQAFRGLQEKGVLPSDLPLFTPDVLDSSFRQAVSKLSPDLLVCFAYGKIFGPKTLELFPLGGVNVHPSLLPRWRGPAPVPYAILAGDSQTGVSIQTLAEKMDRGRILAQENCLVLKTDTAESLLEKCSLRSVALLKKVLLDYEGFLKRAKSQDEEQATYSKLLEKKDGLLDWSCSASELDCRIRAMFPKPIAYSSVNSEIIKILEASVLVLDFAKNAEFGLNGELDFLDNELTKKAKFGKILGAKDGIIVKTGEGFLLIKKLQRVGKKPLFWKDFLNGYPGFLELGFDNI